MEKYIEDVRMENADNGVMICYTERCKRPGKGTYDGGYDYNPRKEVYDFDDDDDEENEEFQKAFDRYKELFMQARKDRLKKK